MAAEAWAYGPLALLPAVFATVTPRTFSALLRGWKFREEWLAVQRGQPKPWR